MALSGWNADQKFKVTIPVDEAMAVHLPLSATAGITDFDISNISAKLTPDDPSDDFTTLKESWWNTDQTDVNFWSSGYDGNISISSGQLLLDPVSNYAGVLSRFWLGGEFEIEIEASKTSGGAFICDLSTDDTGNNRLYFSHDTMGSNVSVRQQISGVWDTATSVAAPADLSFTFKISRNSSNVISFYINDVLKSTRTQSGDQMFVMRATIQDTLVDDFSLNSGTVTWPDAPKNIALEIGETGEQCNIETISKDEIVVGLPDPGDHNDAFYFYYDETHADNTTRTIAQASDDFTGADGDTPSDERWITDYQHGGSGVTSITKEIQSNKLSISCTVTGGSGHQFMPAKFDVLGDFSIEIEFDSLVSDNSGYCGLSVLGISPIPFVMAGVDGTGALILFWQDTSGTQGVASLSDTFGKLRVRRVNTTLYLETASGSGSYVTRNTSTITTGGVQPSFWLYRASAGSSSMDVPSFTVNSADSITGFVGDTGSTPAQQVYNSDYAGSWSMSQDPSGTAPQLLDSTSNGRDGTVSGSMTDGDLVDTEFSKGWDFDGVDDKATIPSFDESALTIITAVEFNTLPTSGSASRIVTKFNGASVTAGSFVFDCLENGTNHTIRALFAQSTTFSSAIVAKTLLTSTRYVVAAACSTTGVSVYFNGVNEDSTTGFALPNSTINLTLGEDDGGSFSEYLDGVQDQTIILNKHASDNRVADEYNALIDNLATWAPVALEEYRKIIEMEYSIKIAKIINMDYGNADLFRKLINMNYGNADLFRKIVNMKYGDTSQFRKIVNMLYNLSGQYRKIIDMPFHVCEQEYRVIKNMLYDLKDLDEFRKLVNMPYAIASGDGISEITTLSVVTEEGDHLDPYHINIEKDEIDPYIDFEIVTNNENDYQLCLPKTIVYITINSDIYTAMVESRDISHDDPFALINYTISLSSPGILLSAAYADLVSGELTGMASSIVRYLVSLETSLSVQWDMIDWYIPSNTLIVSNESPAAIIEEIVIAAGGIRQSANDGTIICRPEFPVSLPDYDDTVPDLYLTDQDNYYSVNTVDDKREDYNVFFIGDQSLSSEGLTTEQKNIDSNQKEVNVFQVPWKSTDTIRLNTSGNSSNVSISNRGIILENIVTEEIEIIDGEGSAKYPIYSTSSFYYNSTNLGSITYTEDGTVFTSTKENSLLYLTYYTKYRQYLVTDNKIENVQVWPEVI